MAGTVLDRTWMWCSDFREDRQDTAGLLVHFKRSFVLDSRPLEPVPIHITADTRYKLYVNQELVAFGPVKGDQHMWFYDEVDIAPYLRRGDNHLAVLVLRFFHSTQYAPSFPRLPFGGLRITAPEAWAELLQSSWRWGTAIDPWTTLRVDEPEDCYLHVYEKVAGRQDLVWTPATLWEFKTSTGNSAPWHLSPRLIPILRTETTEFCAIHNIKSSIPRCVWEQRLLGQPPTSGPSIYLSPGTHHQLDLEVHYHTTAFIRLIFQSQPRGVTGTTVELTYSEGYEDEPVETPYVRRKGNRCDHTKSLYGPRDIYAINGRALEDTRGYNANPESTIIVRPFHFRTFRFIRLHLTVGATPLLLDQILIDRVNYPLDIHAELNIPDSDSKALWDISIRTLINCMHDSYEDCPFYEQLQYAMDARSLALFTYCLSADDRMARQAIIQLHNSFQARIGLTPSRAPTHRPQIIPHFSLFWALMVCDHWQYFADKPFTLRFLAVIEAVLGYFDNRIRPDLGLVTSENSPGIWNYIDWAEEWKPHGMPPVVSTTGISTYTNNLYAYTLRRMSSMMVALARYSRAEEYSQRADLIVEAIRRHCFTGTFFADSIVSAAETGRHPLSQHCQVFSVLSGAATGELAQAILERSLDKSTGSQFVRTSSSMSLYTARALSFAGGNLYDQHFHAFWDPWRAQIANGLTTWQEDDVSVRSDCHAWGSVPVYEFMSEVAGINPAEPGWSAIQFSPRLNLYREFKAKVPFRRDGRLHLACVEWHVGVSGALEVSLEFGLAVPLDDTPSIAVVVCLPRRPAFRTEPLSRAAFTVKAEDVPAGARG